MPGEPNNTPSYQENQMHLVQRARARLKSGYNNLKRQSLTDHWMYQASIAALCMGASLALISMIGLFQSFSVSWALVLLAASIVTLLSSYMLNRAHIAKRNTKETNLLLSQLSQQVEQFSDVQWN